eukprot:9010887-Karenia_brevis.AAC.1
MVRGLWTRVVSLRSHLTHSLSMTRDLLSTCQHGQEVIEMYVVNFKQLRQVETKKLAAKQLARG